MFRNGKSGAAHPNDRRMCDYRRAATPHVGFGRPRGFLRGNDPATFAQDRDPGVVREAIAARNAVNALSEVSLSKLKAAHGIPAH